MGFTFLRGLHLLSFILFQHILPTSADIPLHQETPNSLVGAGSTSHVYLSKSRPICHTVPADPGQLYAIKRFHPKEGHESQAAYESSIRQEFSLARSLSSQPGFADVHTLHEDRGSWYQTMDYYPYAILPALAEGEFELWETECLFRQIVDAVAFLHEERGIAHRDLKLDNILLDEGGGVRVIDFGSAVVGRLPFQEKVEVLFAYGLEGTEPYAAPETYAEKKYDPFAADIWSLGIVLYGLLARNVPWDKSTVQDPDYRRFLSEQSVSFGELPDAASEILRKMLHPDPTRRPGIIDILTDEWIGNIQTCQHIRSSAVRVNHRHRLRKHWKVTD